MAFVPPLTLAEVEKALAGQFEHVQPLPAGGQAAVFRARSVGAKGGEDVAVKVYYGEQVEERTRREIDAICALNSETLVRFHGAGTCRLRGAPHHYIATAFVDGETISALLGRGGASLQQVARVGHDVALAVGALWDRRLVHRDIKPNNIIMTRGGRAVLIDLGLARHILLAALTTQGKTWGTEGYLSPEQMLAQRALTCKSDVFSLGIVMQEMLLGRHPTRRRQDVLANGGAPTAGMRVGIPADVVSLIDRMVMKQAVFRPGPADVAGALRVHLLPPGVS